MKRLMMRILFFATIGIVLLQGVVNCGIIQEGEVDTIGMIDRLYDNRQIDIDTACLYKIYAVTKPDMLPDYLISSKDTSSLCATPIVSSVFEKFDLLVNETRLKIQDLLLPNGELDILIDSDKYPIRVHCPTDLYIDSGYITLKYAEISWETEVNEYGFYPPPSDGGFGGNDYYDVFLRDIPYGGYMSSLTRDYSVDWYSKASYIVINSQLVYDSSGFGELVAHEFNHSCAYTLDPVESFLEGTAEYISEMVFNVSFHDCYTVYAFQERPYRSPEFTNYDMTSSEFTYHYGAAFFLGFLAEYYYDSNPVFIRKLWEDSRQEDWDNEPDFYDTLETYIMDIAGHTLQDMYREFALWRYFTGYNDDGEHFEYANLMGNEYSVRIERGVFKHHLPLIGYNPDNPPAEFGANYIEFYLAGSEGALSLSFTGDSDKMWSVDMILVPGVGKPTEYAKVINMGDYQGTSQIPDIGTYKKAVLVISNLSDGDHDPDNEDWEPSDYTLSAELQNGTQAYIITNNFYYFEGDNLLAELFLSNPGEALVADVVVAFSVGDNLLFYPDWSKELKKVRKTLEESSSTFETILDITVTDNILPGRYTFYAALVDRFSGELIGDLNTTSIDIGIKHAPTAIFTVTPESGTTDTWFELDASLSFDEQDDVSELKVRWGWEIGGWDTPYDYKKTITLKYNITGEYPVYMEVIDSDGNTDQTSRTIIVTD